MQVLRAFNSGLLICFEQNDSLFVLLLFRSLRLKNQVSLNTIKLLFVTMMLNTLYLTFVVVVVVVFLSKA